MERKRLLRLIEAYGADPRRWPPHERADAECALAAMPELAALQREAAALDRLLARDAAPVRPGAEDRLRAALNRLPAQVPPHRGWLGWISGREAGAEPLFAWPQFATFAAAAVLGLMIGASDFADIVAPAAAADILAFDASPRIGIEP